MTGKRWDLPEVLLQVCSGLHAFWFILCCAVLCLVAQSCLTLCEPEDCSLPGPSVHGILQARILEWIVMPSFSGSSQPRDQTQALPHCRQILYCLSHKGSPRLVGSLILLQGIFLIQESNWGLLHCRQILYQLNYQGSLCSGLGTHK